MYKNTDKTHTINPASVRRLRPAHSSITRLRQWLATFTWSTDYKRRNYRLLLPRSDLLNVDSLIYRDILCLDILHILRLGLHPAHCNTNLQSFIWHFDSRLCSGIPGRWYPLGRGSFWQDCTWPHLRCVDSPAEEVSHFAIQDLNSSHLWDECGQLLTAIGQSRYARLCHQLTPRDVNTSELKRHLFMFLGIDITDLTFGQPWPMALRELSVRLEQDEMLRVWSLAQLEARLCNVLSDNLLQVDRFSVSMLQQ